MLVSVMEYVQMKLKNIEKMSKLGFTAGNFDLLHPGYIYTFEEAKKHCDKFIVFLQRDPSVHRKSKYKPIIPLYERYKTLMSIKYIDEVYIYQTEKDLLNLINFLRFILIGAPRNAGLFIFIFPCFFLDHHLIIIITDLI